MTIPSVDTPAKRLNKVLGLYKAEWLNGTLFSLFSEPTYFEQLKTQRSCILIGGRGTGKTTVLKGLSYQGQLALEGAAPVSEWPFYGLYYRVNTTRVTAFRGSGIDESEWASYFGHYINLSFCQLMLEFVLWYQSHASTQVIVSARDLQKIAATLSIDPVNGIEELADEIEIQILEFEAAINTICDKRPSIVSALGAPIDAVSEALTRSVALSGKQFFFLIDEFENFEDYQQRVVNTIVKHASSNYTFKVGVRELGWRQRATLNEHEKLVSPADYALINIASWLNADRFPAFALNVVRSRLVSANTEDASQVNPAHMFPSLGEVQESELLIDGQTRQRLLDSLRKQLEPSELQAAARIRLGHLNFLASPGEGGEQKFADNVRSWLNNPKAWQTRLDNYFYASIFAIRKGKRGIRKYYCGWDVFVSLANGNIRYLLELVHAAFSRHMEDGGEVGEPISPRCQTEAATEVGRKNLSELEGLSVDGGKLTKFVLALGRVLQVMAADPVGHAPEVNQFYITKGGPGVADELAVQRYLDQAVMHLALVRSPGNKLMSDSDTQEYDYRLHPIFAPLFVFSHRRKRKFALSQNQLLGLIEQPRETIKAVLSQSGRGDEDLLPDQLELFGSFYAGN